MVDENPANFCWTARVYFSAWSKKDIISYNRISLRELLVLDQEGCMVYADSDEKLIAKVPGRISMKKMREAVKAHVELELRDLEPDMKIPFENVILREDSEIEEMRAKAGRR